MPANSIAGNDIQEVRRGERSRPRRDILAGFYKNTCSSFLLGAITPHTVLQAYIVAPCTCTLLKADSKIEQKSRNKIMLKAILKTHQTMLWGTLLIKASSLRRGQHAKTDLRRKGAVRGARTFVWAYLGLIRSLQQRSNKVGTQTAQGISSFWARLEPLLPTQICD